MLYDLLNLIATGEFSTQEELAETLDVSPDLVSQMMEQLVRQKYLQASGVPASQCAKGCASCRLAAHCGFRSEMKFWTLTDKGKRAIAT